MHSAIQTAPASKTSFWAGRIISALVVLFMLFDSGIKLMKLAPAVLGTARLGYPVSLVCPHRDCLARLRCPLHDSTHLNSWRDLADGLSWRRRSF